MIPAPPVQEKTCRTCAHALRPGAQDGMREFAVVNCAWLPKHHYPSATAHCSFLPSRWNAQDGAWT
jgi:hypothetical protein